MTPRKQAGRTRSATRRAESEPNLDQIVVQLIAGEDGAPERLRAVRAPLDAIRRRRSQPAWIRTALKEVVAVIDAAVDGTGDAGIALKRVTELLEPVMEGEEPSNAGAPEPARSMALTADAAHELFPEFLQESLDYLAQAESALLELDADASDAEAVNVVLRAFHTIKSSSAFLGLDSVSTLAHDAESLLSRVRDGDAPFVREYADLLLGSADIMRELLAQERTRMADGTTAGLPDGYDPLRKHIDDAVRRCDAHETLDNRDRESKARVAATAPVASVAVSSADTFASSAAGGDATGGSGTQVPDWQSADEWTRVRTLRLDQLVDLVGELAVAHAMVAQDPDVVSDAHSELARKVQHASKIVRELHDLTIGLRMVPLRQLFQRLHRLVRHVADQSGKRVELVREGDETEIDRAMVDVLADPLVHMIRNAVDHAIEPAEERTRVGKPPIGTVRLSARHAGGAVVVELQDDGRGLDRARIRRRAVERGIIEPSQELTGAEIDALIFAPGMSTAESVTELSGRGVGMDVVRRNIESLRGHIEIDTIPGAGTTFTLRLPLTLAVTDGMLVRVADERYIVPSLNILTTFRPQPGALINAVRGGEIVMLHDRPIPIVRLHHVFDIDDAITDPLAALLVVIADRQEQYALLVDELIAQQQFVAKPLTDGLGEVPGLAGSAVLGDGRVGLIVDPGGLLAAARRITAWHRAYPAA